MQNPEVVLNILNQRSIQNYNIENIYHYLYNPEWYLLAYNKLYKNNGAMAKAETGNNVDAMSMKRIENIIEKIRYERYQWHKSKVVEIPKKDGKKRKLSVSEWDDKLVQEVISMILTSIYEPKFSESSHGFRPNRGCHTALAYLRQHSKACEWFIEGDISKCFDSMNHEILLNILRKTIKDNRFINLIQKMLKAGKFGKDFIYGKTYSGIPQGGVLSPLLANIYLNELDQYIKKVLSDRYNKLDQRPKSKEYENLNQTILRRTRKYKKEKSPELLEEIKALKKQRSKLKSKMNIEDCDYRRLSYVRYADDWIMSFTGTFEEAKIIREEIKQYLKDNLNLELNIDKTKITKSTNIKNPAKFLGYNIIVQESNEKITKDKNGRKVRSIGGEIAFLIPDEVITEKKKKYMKFGHITHMNSRIFENDFDIVSMFQAEFRGIVQYYKFARNQDRLNYLKWIIETSMLKTLAAKHKCTVMNIVNKYKSTITIDGTTYKTIEVAIKSNNGKVYKAHFGGIPLVRKIACDANVINDDIVNIITSKHRSTLSERLLNSACAICGSTENIEMHHINKMKNIKGNKSEWTIKMMAMNRKTIPLCHKCHSNITYGKYDGPKI